MPVHGVEQSGGCGEFVVERQVVQDFLDTNVGLIHASRALQQIYEMFEISRTTGRSISEQQATLKTYIEAHGGERLADMQGRYGYLCQIGNGYSMYEHPMMEGYFYDDPESIRGFTFSFKQGNVRYRCVDLDGGKSRAYFDHKNPAEKTDFVQRYADEYILKYGLQKSRRDELRYVPEEGVTAFITDSGSGYSIDTLVKDTWIYSEFGPEAI